MRRQRCAAFTLCNLPSVDARYPCLVMGVGFSSCSYLPFFS